MKYKCSICYPEMADAELLSTKLGKDQVKKKASEYPWKSELKRMASLHSDDVFCNPALEFELEGGGYGFCLRAIGNADNYHFAVWYSFPVKISTFFGLFNRTSIEVIKKEFSTEKAFHFLDLYLEEEYTQLQKEIQEA